jgi:predicted NodU family carbamoyl transferase
MRVCGIHDGHNASACLIDDGRIVAAIEEERILRIGRRRKYCNAATGVCSNTSSPRADPDRVPRRPAARDRVAAVNEELVDRSAVRVRPCMSGSPISEGHRF